MLDASSSSIVVTPNSSLQCHICNSNLGKYKCPKCKSIKYCSVACYKQHQLECTTDVNHITDESHLHRTPTSNISIGTITNESDRSHGVGVLDSNVVFARLSSSSSLRASLSHPELQSIIRRIDSAVDMDKVRLLQLYREQNQDFNKFIQEMIQISNTPKTQGEEYQYRSQEEIDLELLLQQLTGSS